VTRAAGRPVGATPRHPPGPCKGSGVDPDVVCLGILVADAVARPVDALPLRGKARGRGRDRAARRRLRAQHRERAYPARPLCCGRREGRRGPLRRLPARSAPRVGFENACGVRKSVWGCQNSPPRGAKTRVRAREISDLQAGHDSIRRGGTARRGRCVRHAGRDEVFVAPECLLPRSVCLFTRANTIGRPRAQVRLLLRNTATSLGSWWRGSCGVPTLAVLPVDR
jgi:hypothetical protein